MLFDHLHRRLLALRFAWNEHERVAMLFELDLLEAMVPDTLLVGGLYDLGEARTLRAWRFHGGQLAQEVRAVLGRGA